MQSNWLSWSLLTIRVMSTNRIEQTSSTISIDGQSERTANRSKCNESTSTGSEETNLSSHRPCKSSRAWSHRTSSHFTASHLPAQSAPDKCPLVRAVVQSQASSPKRSIFKQSPLSAMELLASGPKISKTHGIALLRVTLFFSCILLVLCLHTEQLLAKGQLVHDCKSTPSLRNGNAQFLVNEVRKFVDNCIKTKDGIRFRKRFPTPRQMAISVDESIEGASSSETDSTQIDLPESTTARTSEKKSKYSFRTRESPETLSSRPNVLVVNGGRPFGRPPALILAAYLKDLPYRSKAVETSNNRIWKEPNKVAQEDE